MRVLSCSLLLALALTLTSSTLGGDEFKLEPGFTLLFNGKDLTGWKTKEGETLEGKTEAYKGRFKVAEGTLTIDPKVKGDKYIYTVKDFKGDLTIRFDHKPDKGCNNDMFIRGNKFDIVPKQIKNLKVDEWNSFEIEVKGDAVEFRSNGETVRKAKAKGAASNFGLRAEFGGVQYRRIRIKAGG